MDDRDVDKERILKDKPYAFEHICMEDNHNLEKIHNQLGYANKMNMKELRKLIRIYCTKFVDNIAEFNKGFYPTINDLLTTYTNMETFVMTSKTSAK